MHLLPLIRRVTIAILFLAGCSELLLAQSSQADWQKVDAGPFSISAPPGWQFHQLQGVDSFVGEFVGDNIILRFDFGRYSSNLKEAKKPKYAVTQKSIGGYRAKLVNPRISGQGVTGVYFRDVADDSSLCVRGQDLNSAQQELALKIFDTIRFGGPPPHNVLPPPSATNPLP
jgi:hypothetical protein